MAAYSSAFTKIAIPTGSTFLDAFGTIAISSARTPLDVTQVGSANGYFISGILNSTLVADIYYNKADHSTIYTPFMNGSQTSFKFVVNEAANDTIEGNGIITGMDVIASNNDIIRGSLTIQTTGTLTFSGLSAAQGSNEVG